MNRFKRIWSVIVLIVGIGLSLQAQYAPNTDEVSSNPHYNYNWVIVLAAIVAGILVAYIIRKRKKADTSHLEEGSINNPASGI